MPRGKCVVKVKDGMGKAKAVKLKKVKIHLLKS